MSDAVKETLCTHCVHLQVCSFKEQYLNAQKAIDTLYVSTHGNTVVCIQDIPWLKTVLACRHHLPKNKDESLWKLDQEDGVAIHGPDIWPDINPNVFDDLQKGENKNA